jgi:hypothetical protein
MKISRLALGAFLFTAGIAALRAQEGGPPQEEIITDFGIDEFIYTPKLTLTLGIRGISGAKAAFTGHGTITSLQPYADSTTPNLIRYYSDGIVAPDSRTITDADGNTTPITPDGYTNSWSYLYAGQVQSDGNMAFHSYNAVIADPGMSEEKLDQNEGVEVVVSKDMGNLTKRLSWKLFAGLSLNELNTDRTENLPATITTITDYYSLNGQTAPMAPYSGPSTTTVAITNANGTSTSQTVDNTTLLGNVPLTRTTTVAAGLVSDHWRVKGGYFTFRTGPSLTYAITDKLKATLSAGAALVLAGSTYSVDQIYTPEVGNGIISTVDDTTEKLLPGYYADATLEYEITDRAGAYAGAVYQSNGSYGQSINEDSASYATRVDMSTLTGFRMGMNFRF